MILTNDKGLAEKARYLTTQAKDDPVRYVHHEIGYNFRLTNIQAALGVAQMEQLQGFMERKREIFSQYQNGLNDENGLTIANVPDYAYSNHWMNLLQIDNKNYGKERGELMQHLKNNGIQTRPVWVLNHLQRPYRKCQNQRVETSIELAKNSLCLPSSSKLTNEHLGMIINQLIG